MKLTSTGVTGLDAQLGGGFPIGSTILVFSDPSNAPFMLNEQFTAAGLNNGQTVYFYSLERPKEEVVEGVKGYLDRDVFAKLVFFDAYAVKLKGLPKEALKTLGISDHAVKVTEDIIPRMLKQGGQEPFRMVVESLTEIHQAYGPEETLKIVEGVSGISRKLQAVSLLTLTKGIAEPKLEIMLQHLVDGVVEFGIDRQGFGLYAYVSITKMRGVSDATKLMLYKETEKGLWLESTRRVN